ncbi:hypothetical protein LHA01_16230 [Schleiferilactobacillus harbinensis]|nr:hypothetical protein LHA01_16230 [Schleiferilactobacillus harbinensis]
MADTKKTHVAISCTYANELMYAIQTYSQSIAITSQTGYASSAIRTEMDMCFTSLIFNDLKIAHPHPGWQAFNFKR